MTDTCAERHVFSTPIINSLTDAYAYMRFLKIRPWYDYTEFRNHVGLYEKKNRTSDNLTIITMFDIFFLAGLAVTRLQAIFGSFLLRRMKNSLLDGKRLIELPKKTVDLVKLEFSQEERDIYTMVSFYPWRLSMFDTYVCLRLRPAHRPSSIAISELEQFSSM